MQLAQLSARDSFNLQVDFESQLDGIVVVIKGIVNVILVNIFLLERLRKVLVSLVHFEPPLKADRLLLNLVLKLLHLMRLFKLF